MNDNRKPGERAIPPSVRCEPCREVNGIDRQATDFAFFEPPNADILGGPGRMLAVPCCDECYRAIGRMIEGDERASRSEPRTDTVGRPLATPSAATPTTGDTDAEIIAQLLGGATYDGEGC